MNKDYLQHSIDLHRADLDLEEFSAALAVLYVSRLIANGGSEIRRPDLDPLIDPVCLGAFLARAVEASQRTGRFEREWKSFYDILPLLKLAWEQGQAFFQNDFARAGDDVEEMEYLSEIEFAADGFAHSAARKAYPHHETLQNWAVSGYLLAWRQHFLSDEEPDP